MPWTRKRGVLDLRGLLLEDADELLADDLPLRLGVVDAGEPREEAIGRVDVDERDAEPVAEGLDDLARLVLAHHPVVDEDAGEPVADRAVDEQRGGGGVDSAGEAADRARLADLGANRLDLLVDHRGRRPALACSRRSRAGSGSAPRSRAGCGRPRGGTGCRRARARCPRSRRPATPGWRRAPRTPAAARRRCRGGSSSTAARPAARRAAAPPPSRSVSSARPNSPAGACSTRPPELVDHQLHAVTDAEHRDAELEQLGPQRRRVVGVDRGGAAGEDERAAGSRCSIWSIGMSWGSSSLKTPHSRMRRAISCEYWPPKSRTRTSSVAVGPAGALIDDRRVSARRCSARGREARSAVSSGAALAAVSHP